MFHMPSSEIVLVFRGGASDFVVNLTSGRTQPDSVQSDGIQSDDSEPVLRRMTDILVGYSTLPGYVSYRNKYNGSWYIRSICEVFMDCAWYMDIEDMLKVVSLL